MDFGSKPVIVTDLEENNAASPATATHARKNFGDPHTFAADSTHLT